MSEVNMRTVYTSGGAANVKDKARAGMEGSDKWYSGVLERIESALSPILDFLAAPRRILSAVILFAVSLLMLLLAFAPIVYTETDLDGYDRSVEYSILEVAEIGVVSLFSLDEYTIASTDYYKDLLEFEAALDSGAVTMNDHEKVAAAIKNALCVELLKYTSPVRAIGPIAVLVAVIYTVLCVIFFISSLVTLIGEIAAYARKAGGNDKRMGKTVRMLWRVSVFLPVLSYSSVQLFSFASGTDLLAFASYGAGVCWGFVISVIIAILASLYFLACGVVGAVRSEAFTIREKKNEILSLLLALVLLVSVSMPLMSLDLNWFQRGEDWGREREASIWISVFDINEITSDTVSSYAYASSFTNIDQLGEVISNYPEDEIDNFDLLNRALIGCARFHPGAVYMAVIILTALTLLTWGVLVRKLASSLIPGLEEKRGGKAQKIFILLFSIATCAVALVMSIVANEALLGAESFTAIFNIGVGPIIMLIASIGMLVMSKNDERLKVEGGYDNADISHAPYVLE